MAASLGIDREPSPLEGRRKSLETDDVSAALDLLVEAFQGVGGVDLGAMVFGEGHEGEDVLLGLVHERRQLREAQALTRLAG